MHRLSNAFTLISVTSLHGTGTTAGGEAVCPGGKRALAGGGTPNGLPPNGLLMRSSGHSVDGPDSDESWFVSWAADNGVAVDAGSVRVWVLCAPSP